MKKEFMRIVDIMLENICRFYSHALLSKNENYGRNVILPIQFL